MADCVSDLRHALTDVPPGGLGPATLQRILPVLAASWESLKGADATSMHGGKLHRVESVTWQPPILSFTMERHGATVMGSTRAELQRWDVDVNAGTAIAAEVGYRQLYQRAPAAKMGPIAEEITRAVISGGNHPALKRHGSSRVSVTPSRIPSITGAFAQTAAGRRRRLREALLERLAGSDWQLEGWTLKRSR